MEASAEHPERMSDPSRPASTMSEDELARMMIERIARQVDLETGRVPLGTDGDAEPPGDDPTASPPAEEAAVEPVEEATAEPVEEAPVELSEEDVSRDLVERIAREVDEESHG